jgi:type VI secretion system protein ImpC
MAEETPGQGTPQPEPAPQGAPEASATPDAELSLLERIVQEGHMAREESQRPYARDLIGELVTQVLDEGMTVRQDTVAAINARIAEIDALISSQLNAIMHDEAFQTLEASWRGLHALVMQTETSTRLKLRLLPATKKELLADLEKAIEFDQSTLFKKLYEEEYGTFGGHPYGLLLGDYEFSRHP